MTTEQRIVATDAARAEIDRLVAKHGRVMLFQPSADRDVPPPLCLPYGKDTLGRGDILLSEIDHCPVYIDRRQDSRWHHPRLLLDTVDGPPGGLSLGGPDRHFVTRIL